jgi:hypothetical protein
MSPAPSCSRWPPPVCLPRWVVDMKRDWKKVFAFDR